MPAKGGATELLEPADDTVGNMALQEIEPGGSAAEDGNEDDTEGDPAKSTI